MLASDVLAGQAPAGQLAQSVLPAAGMFDLEALRRTPLLHDPYDTLTVPWFLRPDALAAVNADFPAIKDSTTFMLEELTYGPAFGAMVAYLRSDDFARLISEKFATDVTALPKMFSVRRFAEPSDGAIHTDSKTKVITILIYFNTEWSQAGGRLRALRSATDIEDYALEVPPINGTLFAFRRSERSWHGFPQATGERRSLQMQYVRPKRSERGLVHKNSLRKRLRRAVVRLFR